MMKPICLSSSINLSSYKNRSILTHSTHLKELDSRRARSPSLSTHFESSSQLTPTGELPAYPKSSTGSSTNPICCEDDHPAHIIDVVDQPRPCLFHALAGLKCEVTNP
ncbi:hypothetical protein Droror1_Dr00020516 [Drosera rotundifolia]